MNAKQPMKGRHTDATNIGMAKQGKGSQPKSMSMGIVSRISRFIRLGAARNKKLRGNTFPLIGRWPSDSAPANRACIEFNILGCNLIFVVGLSVARISDILADDEEFEAELCHEREHTISPKLSNQPQEHDEEESAQ